MGNSAPGVSEKNRIVVDLVKAGEVEEIMDYITRERLDINAIYVSLIVTALSIHFQLWNDLQGGKTEDYILKGGKTILMYAIVGRREDMAKQLIDYGADVNIRSYVSWIISRRETKWIICN